MISLERLTECLFKKILLQKSEKQKERMYF